MNILIVNDDGIEGEGLAALAQELSKKHSVTVVAPDSERSAASHSYSFHIPLRLKKVKRNEMPNIPAYITNGTPSDCVILGLDIVTKGKVDLIISGINAGANVGTDTLASGTVQAALEGCLRGYPSLAVSQQIPMPITSGDITSYFQYAAAMTAKLLDNIDTSQLKEYTLSINFPHLPKDEIKGIKVCPVGVSKNNFSYKPQKDFVDRVHYWINAERTEHEYNLQYETDAKWIDEGFITVTPLSPNLTAENRMQSAMQLVDFSWK